MLTIGITTFEYRFEKYFVPLMQSLKMCGHEVLVAVNGEHKQPFNEPYRHKVLCLLADCPTVYPIFFPTFRGLSKLWNTLVIHASNEKVLLLNDDVMVEPQALANVDALDETTIINNSFSHWLVTKQELDAVGYFDERLLGIGEEDGDFMHRYIRAFNREMPRAQIHGIHNFSAQNNDYRPTNIRNRPGMRYSQFNREMVYEQKYRRGGYVRGMFDTVMEEVSPCERQYPYERFFIDNRGKL
jgi:hypothetical protein